MGEVADAVTAPLAARVRSLHTTDTGPAARGLFTVMIILSNTYTDETDVDAGDAMWHLSVGAAVTRPDGNVRVILSSTERKVEVVNVTVAVPCKNPTALLIVSAVAVSAVTAPTAGVLT